MSIQLLKESIQGAFVNGEVDSTPCVKRVKMLGWESSNGRRYLKEAVEKALPMYENGFSYFDHPNVAPRSFISKFGRFKNVRIEEDGLYGDYYYNADHIHAKTFEGWLKYDPSGVGFSHTVYGKIREGKDGVKEVYEITKVESIDLVDSPATTKGLFESMDPLDTNDEGYAAKLGELVAAIMKDETLDVDSKKKKLLTMLKLMDEEEGGDKKEEEEEKDDKKEEEEEEEEKDDVVESKLKAFETKLAAILEATEKRIEAKLKIKEPVSIPGKGDNSKRVTVDDILSGYKG